MIINHIDVTTSADTAICGSSTVKLSANGGSGYSWFPATGLDNPISSNPTATPLVTTKYYVTVGNENGCTKKDSVTISVNSSVPVYFNNITTPFLSIIPQAVVALMDQQFPYLDKLKLI